jgi:hypothetical protein
VIDDQSYQFNLLANKYLFFHIGTESYGIGKVGGYVKVLLDVEKLVT